MRKIIEGFGNPFGEHSFPKELTFKEVLSNFMENREVSLAGRLIAKREHGKSSFGHLSDYTAKIQIYAQLNSLGKDYQLFKELDIGDIIGVKGKLFKTKTGEPTVFVEELKLLSKVFRPLPEKWHGLRDVEIRYRQRYLDLIANPQAREIFIKRSQIMRWIREFFDGLGYLEVETPLLHPLAGGASGKPFITYHQANDCQVYLRIAPELYLKRLLVGGLEKIYELNRSFRNEGVSARHSPEFTMLEAYCAFEDYAYMMHLCEEFISSLVKRLYGSTSLEYQGKKIDVRPPWPRISFAGLFEEEFGVKPDDGQEAFLEKVIPKIEIKEKGLSRSQILKITEELLERHYPQDKPAFIIDFFTWTSPLAKRKKDNPYLVERFELFIGDLEVANAYSELNDPLEQKERFLKQLEIEEELPKKIDTDFLTALEYGMPPAAGLGIGIDRLLMVLLNQPSIREVIFFPLLKPLAEEDKG